MLSMKGRVVGILGMGCEVCEWVGLEVDRIDRGKGNEEESRNENDSRTWNRKENGLRRKR